MERKIHNLVQGSDEWHQFRLEHFGASEAAAMLGLSSKTQRNELLRAKHTGVATEYSAWVQEHILDRGHEVEALARPMVEALLGEMLYPVTYSMGRLSASCDGLTMDDDVAFEHKLHSAALFAAVLRQELPDEYMPQCQQILLVTGAKRVIFVCSDGTPDRFASMQVLPDPAWQDRIVAGWRQFEQDLADYQPTEVIPAAVAAPQMALPAVSVQVNGSIQVYDNLTAFGDALTAYVERINKSPKTDQDFADLEATVKVLKGAEDALDAAENGALAQASSIDEMRRAVGHYRDVARNSRLVIEKLVKAEKENRRMQIVRGAADALEAHIKALDKRIGQPMPAVQADFAAAIRGLKTLSSIKNAVDTELANAKIRANEIADRIHGNINLMRERAAGYEALFPDAYALCANKAQDDLDAIIYARINDHKAAEEKRLEAEREKIRAEERAKAEAMARAAQPVAIIPDVALAQAFAPAPAQPVAAPEAKSPGANTKMVKLGDINARIAPLSITAAGLEQLGFAAAGREKNAVLYPESAFPAMCTAIIRHVTQVSGMGVAVQQAA